VSGRRYQVIKRWLRTGYEQPDRALYLDLPRALAAAERIEKYYRDVRRPCTTHIVTVTGE